LRWWAAVVPLLILAFGMRVWDLTEVPPGLTHDEASNGHDAAAILEGEHRLYFPVGYGHEPLYNYSVAAATLLLGQSIFTLRITTVAWGVAQIILTVALSRRWWGRRAALATLGAYAVSFWALMLSRVGLRAPALPALLAASVLAYDHATEAPARSRAWASYAVSGLLLGASLYTYMASRGMPLLYVVSLLGLAITDRVRLRRVWRGTLVVLVTAAIVAAPLFLYLQANPHLELRIGQLGSAITALVHWDVRPLWANVRASWPMLIFLGDPQWLYNIAGRPGLELVPAVLFGTGVAVALKRWRDRRSQLLLIWLAGGMAPALLAPVEYNLLHAIAAMPPALLAIGLATQAIPASATVYLRRFRRTRPWLAYAIHGWVALAFLMTLGEAAHAYFVTWANNRNVRVAYHHHVVALGRHLDDQDDTRPVVMTSLYPGEYHDAYAMEVTLRREDLSLRWADGRDALFVPATEARLFVEQQTRPPDVLWALIEPDLAPLTTLAFREDDIPSRVDGYTWAAPAGWARITDALSRGLMAQAGDPPPASEHVVIEAPTSFGNTVSLEGYTYGARPLVPGSRLTLLTAWTVSAATDAELVIFAHLLHGDGTLVTQDDRLAAPSWQWQAGDRFIHLHRLDLPADLAPGTYHIAVGLYDRVSSLRPALAPVSGRADPTRALISLEVSQP